MSNLDQQTLVDQLSVHHRTIHLTRACQLLWPALVVHCVAWHMSTGYVQENVGEALRTQLFQQDSKSWQCPQNFWMIAPFWYTWNTSIYPLNMGIFNPNLMVYFRCQSNSIGSNQVFWTSPNLFSRSGSAHCSFRKKKEVKGQRGGGRCGVDMCGSTPSWEDGKMEQSCLSAMEMNTSFSSNKYQ